MQSQNWWLQRRRFGKPKFNQIVLRPLQQFRLRNLFLLFLYLRSIFLLFSSKSFFLLLLLQQNGSKRKMFLKKKQTLHSPLAFWKNQRISILSVSSPASRTPWSSPSSSASASFWTSNSSLCSNTTSWCPNEWFRCTRYLRRTGRERRWAKSSSSPASNWRKSWIRHIIDSVFSSALTYLTK